MQAYLNQPKHAPISLPVARLILVAVCLMLAVASGCSRIRLPAIDPTGACLFAPKPITTTLALPGSAGEGHGICKHKKHFGHGLGWPCFGFPKPAFSEPAEPPKCVVPAPAPQPQTIPPGGTNEPFVPSAPCNGDCQDGPPAVMQESHHKHLLKLPGKGKRGCILLTPQKVVAPVGGEVMLLSGICGTDGYLQMGEPLEWMLTPDSVGTFIEVGDDSPGFAHRLAGIKRAEKQDQSFARGVTSTKRTLITRGNKNTADDVQLEKGQTWLTVSSPNEGTSHITVLAPESECWDNRKASTTIYWIDARWQFPGPQIVPAGTPASLVTRVTRAEGSLPARGWKVRYEIMQPELATFAGTNGSSVVEVEVDESGNAIAELIPNPGTSGITAIDMQVIRPGGVSDNIPTMTLGRGQTFVTWSSPQLAIRAGAPEFATFNVPVRVVANISNPGDQPANDVRVSLQIPPSATAVSPDAFAQNLPSAIVWELGTIPPKTQLDIFADVTAQAPTQLTFQARGEAGLVAEDSVRIDVYRPSLSVAVNPEPGQYVAGQPVTFNIDIKNTGDRPLQNVNLVATGDGLMIHQETGNQSVRKPKDDGPLQPGEDWLVAVTFVPTESGRRCITVEATADGGQREQSEACVTVINPIPPTPALTLSISGPEPILVGETRLFRSRVTNTGQVPLNNVRVTMSYDPQLLPVGATDEVPLDTSRTGQYLLAWNIPSLEPNKVVLLEATFEATQTNPRSQIIMTARSDEGATANETYTFQIVPDSRPPSVEGPQPAAPVLPPLLPPPAIPGGPAPIPGSGTPPGASLQQGASPPALPVRSERLQLSLTARDNPVRVNDPIRYTLTVTNDASTADGQVSMRFQLPAGVSVSRVTRRGSNTPLALQRRSDFTYLPDIRSMRPGESIDFLMVLTSNQPQTFELAVEAVSQQTPDATVARSQTNVLP
jgi:hypothetical protein